MQLCIDFRMSSTNQNCYVCDNKAVPIQKAVPIFEAKVKAETGKLIVEVLKEILNSNIEEDKVHSRIVCKKCYNVCKEYDELQTRVWDIKTDFNTVFKKTLDNYNPKTLLIKSGEILKMPPKTLVLPASKLKPLPSNYVFNKSINVGKVASVANPKSILVNSQVPSKINLKVTIGNSILTQTINTSSAKLIPKLTTHNTNYSVPVTPTNIDIKSVKMSALPSKDTNMITCGLPSIMNSSPVGKTLRSLDLKIDQGLPKDFLTSPVKPNFDAEKHVNYTSAKMEDNEEQAKEIDEECMLSTVDRDLGQQNQMTDKPAHNVEVENEMSLLEMEMRQSEERDAETAVKDDGEGTEDGDNVKYVIGKVEILEDENSIVGDEQAIVMEEDENGSVIRLVSGQKWFYENNEISLIIQEQGTDNDSSDEGQNDDKNNDEDSNEESQIELEMSGNEETANAIINAARQQGAYIKVESGEMFKVETVEADSDSMVVDTSQYIVEHYGDKLFKCLLCENINNDSAVPLPASVGSAASMMTHVKRQHNARVYICHTCGLIMRKKSDYVAHMLNHSVRSAQEGESSNKLYECSTCLKKFKSRPALSEHARSHDAHACPVCSKLFATKYTQQAHLKTHQERPRPFKCTQCSKAFFTQQNLTQHEKIHTGIKDFVCKICGKAFGTQHNLEVHNVIHTGVKPFVCSFCNKAFARRAEITDHIRTHTGERPFRCELCAASFSQRSNLQSHKRATHYNDKRHACPHCDKRFKRRRLLEYHVKASHTGERPYSCSVCHATFVYPEHYKKHMRIHSGEQPYQCEICGKSFNSRDNRNTHRFVHSDKKPYECVVCGAGFMRKPVLYAHMKSMGHLSETIVVNQPRMFKVKEQRSDEECLEEEDRNVLESVEESTEDNSYGTPQVYTVNFEDATGATEQIFGTGDLTGKTLNLVPDSDVPTLLTLTDNLISSETDKTGTVLSTDDQAQGIQVVAKSEDGQLVRLVHMQISDGNQRWVALDS